MPLTFALSQPNEWDEDDKLRAIRRDLQSSLERSGRSIDGAWALEWRCSFGAGRVLETLQSRSEAA